MSNLCERCKYGEKFNNDKITSGNTVINMNGKDITICTNSKTKVMNFNEDFQISCSLFEEKENQ